MRKFHLVNPISAASKQCDQTKLLTTTAPQIYSVYSEELHPRQNHAVYSEARDLLNQWVAKSLLNDDQADSEASLVVDDIPLQVPSRLEIKKEWDHFLKSKQIDVERNQLKPCHKKLSQTKAQIELELQRTKYVEKRVAKIHGYNEKPSPINQSSTLDRILQRQEEAKARRELRRQEAEARRADEAIRKQASREALQLVKQMDEAQQREERREEELVRLQMVQIRRQLEVDRERANRERCREWLSRTTDEPGFKENEPPSPVPAPPPPSITSHPRISQEFAQFSATKLLYPSPPPSEESRDDKLPVKLCFSAETKLKLKQYFFRWRQQTHQTRTRLNAMAVRSDCRLQRSVLRAWKLATVQARFDREVERAKEQARIMERKETQAVDFHNRRLVRIGFLAWQTALKLSRNKRSQEERDQRRHCKETEFLEQLRSQSARSKMTDASTETNSLHGSRATKTTQQHVQRHAPKDQYPLETDRNRTIEKCTVGVQIAERSPHTSDEQMLKLKPKPRTKQSTMERRNLPTTLIKQRQRIAEQNREIEDLKSAKRYTELLLEARAHALADQLLQQASQQAIRLAQSVVHQKDSSSKANPPLDRSANAPRAQSARPDSGASKFSRSIRSARSECSDEHCSDVNLPLSDSGSRSRERPTTEYSKNSFLIRMEKQAAERARLKAEREERRRLAELKKKEEMARQLEEEAIRMKEERRAMLAAQRAKQREEEERKKKQMERIVKLRELQEKADRHLAHQRVLYYGMLPWKRFIVRQRTLIELAENHAKQMLLSSTLHAWLHQTRAVSKAVTELIDRVRNRMILRRAFLRLQLACELTRQAEQQANAWYEQELMRRTLSTWSIRVTEIRIWEWQLEDVAQEHWLQTLKRRCMTAWRGYPQLMREEREREHRRERLRGKLRDLVPDFSPPHADDSELT